MKHDEDIFICIDCGDCTFINAGCFHPKPHKIYYKKIGCGCPFGKRCMSLRKAKILKLNNLCK